MRHTARLLPTLFGLILVLAPALALAGPPKIMLNDVDITGVTDQTFENATVRIDGQGNIMISAPQYKVEVQGESGDTSPTTPAAVAGSYFLVVNNSAPGKVQYELDIYINGILQRTIKDKESQVVVEISDKLVNGRNSVRIDAKKATGISRQSVASSDAISLMVGKGSSAGNQLTIERQVLSFRVDASQTEDKSEDFTFEVK